ncbi:MAG: hypothetical protein JW902_11575 [Syntrophaceae bacterium]|nr:hypothetical protein [Syntrophaceae bacterium]
MTEIKNVTFCDFFKVSPRVLEKHGAFNISLVSDLPLFIDPFLLFNSKNDEYRGLHDQMIQYLRFLRDQSTQSLDAGLVQAWYSFPEVRQNWLGFSTRRNRGRGLGKDFARALNGNLHSIFRDFGNEKVTKESHLEKLCLIAPGVGKDKISDFTTNLIKGYLLDFTQKFALASIDARLRKRVAVSKVRFNYDTRSWMSEVYELPFYQGSYVILTPKAILTKDETWINKIDLIANFDDIPPSIPNEQLRSQINSYFLSILPKEPTQKDQAAAVTRTIVRFPEIIDYYIRYKEDHADRATSISIEKVAESEEYYAVQFRSLVDLLAFQTAFYKVSGVTYQEAYQRVMYFKDVIENKRGYRRFYFHGEPIEREEDLHILYRMTWFASVSDVTTEANDGRGPVDFKISMGSKDKTLVEFKLAKNSQLKRNLQKQVEVYKRASDAQSAIKVIIYFTRDELKRVERILKELDLLEDKNIILVDARRDNKPSGSKA